MTLHFLQLIRARFFNTAADTAIDLGIKNETNARLAIDAGGKLQWGDGTLSADTNLYRSAANTLKTDNGFIANTITSGGAVITASAAGNLPLRIRGAASQTANLQEWQDSSGTTRFGILPDGTGFFGRNNTLNPGVSRLSNYFGDAGGNLVYWSYNARFSGGWVKDQASQASAFMMIGNYSGFGGSALGFYYIAPNTTAGIGSFIYNGVDGTVRFGNVSEAEVGATAGAQVLIRPSTLTRVGLIVRGVTSQSANLQEWQLSNSTVAASISSNGSFSTTGSVTVGGNLTVNGTTFTVNSTTVTIDDPIFTLGGDTAPTIDDNKDRGIEFRWHDGTSAKVGFFGLDDSTGKFTFIPDATNTSEVFSGTKGIIDANLEWADVLNKPTLFNWDTPQTLSAKTASYTLLTADVGTAVTFDSTTAVNCTIDGSLNLTPGQRIDVIQLGTGQVTFVASSATVNATPGLKMRSRYSAATIICVATDSYVVVGDLSA